MSRIVPASRPQATRDAVLTWALDAGVQPIALVDRAVLLGRRGYYRDTMGRAGANDIGVYDDAMFLLTPTELWSWNANTDPSRRAPRMATLTPGVWRYEFGIHGLSKPPERRYRALVQAAPVTVLRQPDAAHAAPWLDTGWFGINIHRGGEETTGSEGCQTIHPSQWDAFLATVDAEMRRFEQSTILYVLTDRGDAPQ